MQARQIGQSNATPFEDAFEILRADHRRIERCFARFAGLTTSAEQATAMREALQALNMHLDIEEKILYPSYLHATHDRARHRRWLVEHAQEKGLIEDITFADPGEDPPELLMGALMKRVASHICEEESDAGLFQLLRLAGIDLQKLARALRHYRDNRIALNAVCINPTPPM